MTPNQNQGSRHQKYPTYVHCSTPSPKFSNVFPIDSYVKISLPNLSLNLAQIGWKLEEECFEIFAPIGSHVNEKEKQIVKNWKLWKKNPTNKIGLEIWWRASYPQNLAWIHAAVSEKPEFNGR